MSSQNPKVYHMQQWWDCQASGMREYLLQDGRTYYWRRRNTDNEWTPYQEEQQSREAPEQDPLRLVLVRENQAAGEPRHWSLFVARENQAGTVFQVSGDAMQMEYAHLYNANLLLSDTVADSYVLTPELSETAVRRIADSVRAETPPSAPNQREVRENCQGWTVRVLRRLAASGVVKEDWIRSAQGMMDPLK